ncbi:MAG: transketolase family protein [Clostridiales bacterium]|jgi:transketolase|nr:transketolase family protein [Clostridiales bacterium]
MKIAIREAYGQALLEYGRENEDVVVLDADVSGSTKSALFKKEFPDRFFNVGIAEANMTAMAAGFAAAGKIPFVNSFAAFVSTLGLLPARAFASYSKLPIKLMGAYGGLSDAFDGPSHHAIEDIAIMRALPSLKVYVVSDVAQTRWAVRHAIEDKSPMYIRLSRDYFPDQYASGETFCDGKAKLLAEGGDVTIIACGLMVGHAVAAAESLKAEGISARVVDMFTIKPLDSEIVLESAAKTGAIVTAEEHSVIGGLGGAVCEALCEGAASVPLTRVGMADRHAECGPYAKLLRKYGLDRDAIVAAVKKTLAKKQL